MASGSSVQARMSASTFSFSMYLFASAIIFSLSLGITMPFSKLGYISFPNRDIIFSLSPLQVTSSGGEVHLPYVWNRIPRKDRLLLGTLFLNHVSKMNGNLKAIEKTSSNQQRYKKTIDKF